MTNTVKKKQKAAGPPDGIGFPTIVEQQNSELNVLINFN